MHRNIIISYHQSALAYNTMIFIEVCSPGQSNATRSVYRKRELNWIVVYKPGKSVVQPTATQIEEELD